MKIVSDNSFYQLHTRISLLFYFLLPYTGNTYFFINLFNPIKERHDLAACTVLVDAERAVTEAVRDTVL